jgi:hypothetical protein
VALPQEPDLSDAREAVEELMTDVCRIWRDKNAKRTDALDPVTLKLIRPPSDDQMIYDETSTGLEDRPLEGKCRFRIRAETDPKLNTDGGDRLVGPRLYEMFIPWDAPVAARGDMVVCTFSLRDVTLVDYPLRIADVIRTSLLVHRKYILRDLVIL